MEIRACIHGLPYRRPELHEAYVVRLHSMPGSIHIHKFGNMSGGRIHDIDKGGCPAPDELACLLPGVSEERFLQQMQLRMLREGTHRPGCCPVCMEHSGHCATLPFAARCRCSALRLQQGTCVGNNGDAGRLLLTKSWHMGQPNLGLNRKLFVVVSDLFLHLQVGSHSAGSDCVGVGFCSSLQEAIGLLDTDKKKFGAVRAQQLICLCLHLIQLLKPIHGHPGDHDATRLLRRRFGSDLCLHVVKFLPQVLCNANVGCNSLRQQDTGIVFEKTLRFLDHSCRRHDTVPRLMTDVGALLVIGLVVEDAIILLPCLWILLSDSMDLDAAQPISALARQAEHVLNLLFSKSLSCRA
mmetsp:Transcript_5274/g.11492  ORF Transcript_5274/g.11492 Transcript_5274/m.11492 type:complete len:353 (-) Transcript_5274:11-1069(-)